MFPQATLFVGGWVIIFLKMRSIWCPADPLSTIGIGQGRKGGPVPTTWKTLLNAVFNINKGLYCIRQLISEIDLS